MAIENNKLVTLGGLAEYNKAVPDIAQVAVLMMMEDNTSLAENKTILSHILGTQWCKITYGVPIKLIIPSGTKYIVVENFGGALSNITVAQTIIIAGSTNSVHEIGVEGKTWEEAMKTNKYISTVNDYIPSRIRLEPSMFPNDSTQLYHMSPLIYVTDANINLSSYEDSSKLIGIGEPNWLSYSSTNKSITANYDILNGVDSNRTIIGNDILNNIVACVSSFDSDTIDKFGFNTAIPVANNDYNTDNLPRNSGIITVDTSKDYYVQSFNVLNDDTTAYCKVTYFDHYGIARMHSRERYLDAYAAYNNAHHAQSST